MYVYVRVRIRCTTFVQPIFGFQKLYSVNFSLVKRYGSSYSTQFSSVDSCEFPFSFTDIFLVCRF